MKKNFMYAMMSAIALTGAVSFSACSSSDEIVDNPDYNPETNSVKTAITLSIDPNGSKTTRMAAATAQVGTNTFRGIQDIYLIPSAEAISASTSTTSKIYLGAIATDGFNVGESQKTYIDKEVPVGTSNFLFLGKATQGTVTSIAGKLANGYTTNNIGAGNNFTATTIGNIAITAEGIAPVTTEETPALTTAWTEPSGALASYLTTIANVNSWKSTENANLQNIRNTFISETLRAGSSKAILLTLQRLYNALGTDDVSAAVKTAITANLDVKSGTVPNAVLGWVAEPAVSTNFPNNLGLPEGAAQYQWDPTADNNTGAFVYVTTPTLNAENTAVKNIIYPNELYYLTSTTLKETSTPTISWPGDVSLWTSQAWSGWDGTVQPTSKNIALYNNIQYGTALLSTTVKVEGTTLYDNAKAKAPDLYTENKPITVTATSFPLTGVLVGGQPSQVGWNFLPLTSDFTKVVYDSIMPSGIYAASTTASAKNYTLVFDNYATNANTQADVSICLEFRNDSGSEFYGSDGIILKGQKFYIVGKLAIGTNTFPFPAGTTESTIAAVTRSFYPSTDMRVFIQDFETIADCKLTAGSTDSPGSLGKAFVTIPDLRSTNQTLGLSVDLAWKNGVTFDVNLGE